ncbi:MAG: SDR family NAD(P)-dependent oxidoreductase [Pseudoflavonifractor sp.]|nr:SDR family NAD(P)-dependent oxidoreductase [Pseudoflavonifractor sp.]
MNILIIGATSGIGYELWKHYTMTGNSVAIIGRRDEILQKQIKDNRDNSVAFKCDIADLSSFDFVLRDIMSKLRHLDLAIICAGVGELNPELELSTELVTISVNVNGWTNVIDSIYKIFEAQKSGHLVAITSVGGLQPTPIAPSYSASKAFQINYIKSLQRKSKGTSLVVTEIRPGLVKTRMAKGDGLFWVMSLDRVVKEIVKAIDKNRRLKIVTTRWRIINFLLKHFV